MLYDKGLLKLNILLIDILFKYFNAEMDEKWNMVTIRDVLLHIVGFDIVLLDIDCNDASQY